MTYIYTQLFTSMLDIQYCLGQVPWSQFINYHLDWLPNFKVNIRKRVEIKKMIVAYRWQTATLVWKSDGLLGSYIYQLRQHQLLMFSPCKSVCVSSWHNVLLVAPTVGEQHKSKLDNSARCSFVCLSTRFPIGRFCLHLFVNPNELEPVL